MSKIKFTEIYEGHLIADNRTWTCEIDGKTVPLCLYIEILDMYEMTGEAEYNDYPYFVSFEIFAKNPSSKFYEGDGKADRFGKLSDCKSYMGGVPIGHMLLSTDSLNENITGNLKAKDAKLTTDTVYFGTLAAQQGKGSKITYPQFKTYAAAETWAKAMVERYADAHMSLVGLVLDKPINMMGQDGWSVIQHQKTGKRG